MEVSISAVSTRLKNELNDDDDDGSKHLLQCHRGKVKQNVTVLRQYS
jgi:hypothetical protein